MESTASNSAIRCGPSPSAPINHISSTDRSLSFCYIRSAIHRVRVLRISSNNRREVFARRHPRWTLSKAHHATTALYQQMTSIGEPIEGTKVSGGELTKLASVDLEQVHLPRFVAVGQVLAIAGDCCVVYGIAGRICGELSANNVALRLRVFVC